MFLRSARFGRTLPLVSESSNLRRQLRELQRERGGRPPHEPTTDDGRLVRRACRMLCLTRAGLARRIGCAPATLSRDRIPQRWQAAIRAEIANRRDDSR